MSEKKKIPNANKKLKNLEAVQKMLDGTHKSQTRKYSGWTGKSVEKRVVGERWTDANGVVWEQREGYRIQGVDRMERMTEIRQFLEGTDTCPECKTKMSKRLDKKYYGIHKMCMDCSIDLEHKMRLDGTWKEYERKRVLENIKSWLKDAEIEKEYLKRELGKDSYVNSDGTLEKWDLPYDVEAQKNRIDEGFEKLKSDLLTKYGATEQELNEYLDAQKDENG